MIPRERLPEGCETSKRDMAFFIAKIKGLEGLAEKVLIPSSMYDQTPQLTAEMVEPHFTEATKKALGMKMRYVVYNENVAEAHYYNEEIDDVLVATGPEELSRALDSLYESIICD